MCAQVQYPNMHSFRLHVLVHVDELVCGPQRCTSAKRELCRVGRKPGTDSWYLDICKVSVSPSGSVLASDHREEHQGLLDRGGVRLGGVTAAGPVTAHIYSCSVIMRHQESVHCVVSGSWTGNENSTTLDTSLPETINQNMMF